MWRAGWDLGTGTTKLGGRPREMDLGSGVWIRPGEGALRGLVEWDVDGTLILVV